jgi:acyl-CoA synthetase (AMP-forming)/AMP-acid ligase II
VGVAFVERASDAKAPVDELRAHARGRLANYEEPKRFKFIDELPRVANGKVDRVALRRAGNAPVS